MWCVPNLESYQEDKFENNTKDLSPKDNLFIGRSFALLTPVMTAVSAGFDTGCCGLVRI